MTQKVREIIFYKNYFNDFFKEQNPKVREKIQYILETIKSIDRLPLNYFKHLEGTDSLFEIIVKFGSDTFRIFCFFDKGKLVVLANGFQKKTQKTPPNEILKAEKIKKEYFNEK